MATHIVGALPGWILRETIPAACYLFLAEVVVADALAAGDVANYLVALAFEEGLELGCLLEDVVVVATAHASVRGDYENRGDVAVFTLAQHRVL